MGISANSVRQMVAAGSQNSHSYSALGRLLKYPTLRKILEINGLHSIFLGKQSAQNLRVKVFRKSDLLLLTILEFANASNAGASTYFVSPEGSDSSRGTSSQPFRSVAKGVVA